MKKVIQILLLSIISISLAACNGKKKEAAQLAVKTFYEGIQQNDTAIIRKFYPAFDSIGGFYKSSKIEILQTNMLDNDGVEVTIKNFFTNISQKNFDQKITLMLKPSKQNKDQYQIYDSRGISGIAESGEYKFAVKTGVIKRKSELTDLQATRKIAASNALIIDIAQKELAQLKKEVVISDWKWNYAYSPGSVEGKGKLHNNSQFTFRYLKCNIQYNDDSGREVKMDESYLVYDSIVPGETKDFSTYSNEVYGATMAYISINFNKQELLERILEADYKGDEYAKFTQNGGAK